MIPKIVYQTWFEKNLPPKFQIILNTNRQLNPEYKFIIYDNLELNQFFNDLIDYPLIKKAYFRLNPKYGSARADLFRYMIIYLNGGIYLDIKIQCKRPFKEWINDKENGYFSYWHEKYNKNIFKNENGELQNWFLIMKAKDRNLLNLLNVISFNILNAPIQNNYGKETVLMYTGPINFTFIFLNKIKEYKLIQSSDYLIYNTNSFQNETYKHYSELTEPLFTTMDSRIDKKIYINIKKFENSGLYILEKYKSFLGFDNLIKNCDVFIAIKNNKIYMLGFSNSFKEYIQELIIKLKNKNEYKIFYYKDFCIKQGYINEKNILIFDNNFYCQFIL